jgi:hypothetical protein
LARACGEEYGGDAAVNNFPNACWSGRMLVSFAGEQDLVGFL